MLLFNFIYEETEEEREHFNTSNVTIQLRADFSFYSAYVHFNTSNVTIQRIEPVFLDLP